MRRALLSSAALVAALALPIPAPAAEQPVELRDARAAAHQAVRTLDKTARARITGCERRSRSRIDCRVRITARAPYTSCTARIVLRRTAAGRIRASIPDIQCVG